MIGTAGERETQRNLCNQHDLVMMALAISGVKASGLGLCGV